ncbi:MAG TPA: CHASE2 domain-containing protein, partial [Methylocystis sp.]|nr:CHASE2 domain-containing protein [Methylocystis sp.]
MTKQRRVSWFLALLGIAAAWVVACGAAQPALLDDLRNLAFDSFQRLAPRAHDAEAPALVVGVDEESLKKLGQWPWPRTRLADLSQKLGDLGAATIAFDFVFSEADRASYENFAAEIPDDRLRKRVSQMFSGARSNDEIFASALGRTPSVLGMTLAAKGVAAAPPQKAGFAFAGDDPTLFAPAFAAVVTPLPPLEQAARGIGATNWMPDRDQSVRRIPLFDQSGGALVPALA